MAILDLSLDDELPSGDELINGDGPGPKKPKKKVEPTPEWAKGKTVSDIPAFTPPPVLPFPKDGFVRFENAATMMKKAEQQNNQLKTAGRVGYSGGEDAKFSGRTERNFAQAAQTEYTPFYNQALSERNAAIKEIEPIVTQLSEAIFGSTGDIFDGKGDMASFVKFDKAGVPYVDKARLIDKVRYYVRGQMGGGAYASAFVEEVLLQEGTKKLLVWQAKDEIEKGLKNINRTTDDNVKQYLQGVSNLVKNDALEKQKATQEMFEKKTAEVQAKYQIPFADFGVDVQFFKENVAQEVTQRFVENYEQQAADPTNLVLAERQLNEEIEREFSARYGGWMEENVQPIVDAYVGEINIEKRKATEAVQRIWNEAGVLFNDKKTKYFDRVNRSRTAEDIAAQSVINQALRGVQNRNELQQKALRTYVKSNPATGLGNLFGNSFAQGFSEYASNFASYLNSLGLTGYAIDDIKGWGSNTSREAFINKPTFSQGVLDWGYYAQATGQMMGQATPGIIAAAMLRNPVMATIATNINEGISMAGGKYQQMLAEGFSPDEASAAANDLVLANTLTMPSDYFFMKLFSPFKKSGVRDVAANVIGQSAQEVVQTGFEQSIGYDDVTFSQGVASKEAFDAGGEAAAASLVMGGFAAGGKTLLQTLFDRRNIPNARTQQIAAVIQNSGVGRANAGADIMAIEEGVTEQELAEYKAEVEKTANHIEQAKIIGLNNGQQQVFAAMAVEVEELQEVRGKVQDPIAAEIIDEQIADKKREMSAVVKGETPLATIELPGGAIFTGTAPKIGEMLQIPELRESIKNGEVKIVSTEPKIVKEIEKIQQEEKVEQIETPKPSVLQYDELTDVLFDAQPNVQGLYGRMLEGLNDPDQQQFIIDAVIDQYNTNFETASERYGEAVTKSVQPFVSNQPTQENVDGGNVANSQQEQVVAAGNTQQPQPNVESAIALKDINGVDIKVGDTVKSKQPDGGVLPSGEGVTGVVEQTKDAFGNDDLQIRFREEGRDFDQFILLTGKNNEVISNAQPSQINTEIGTEVDEQNTTEAVAEQKRTALLDKLYDSKTGDFAIYNKLPKNKRKIKLDAISKRVATALKEGVITQEDAAEIQNRINNNYTELGVDTRAEDAVASEQSIPAELLSLFEGEGIKDKTKAKQLSDKVRSLRIANDSLYGGFLGLGVAVYNGFLSTVATAIDAGASIADIIKAGIDYVKANSKLSEQEVTDGVTAELAKMGFKEPPKEPPTPREPPKEGEGFERKEGKKSTLSRAAEGEVETSLKDKISSYGLSYDVQTQTEAKAIAKKMITEIGIKDALIAVRENYVDGAEASQIFAEAIDAVGRKLAVATDPEIVNELLDQEAALLDEFDRRNRTSGRGLAILHDIYINSDLGYKLSAWINRYKAANDGEIPAEVEEKYKELDKGYQEVKKRLEELEQAEIDRKANEEIQAIKESIVREKKQNLSYKQKAKRIATALRQGKTNRPGIFMSATPVSLLFDTAIEVTAKTIEAGGVVADAIKAGLKVLQDSDWYKGLTNNKKAEAEKSFEDYVTDITTPVKPKATIKNGRLNIPDSMIRNYVEQGVEDINELVDLIKNEISPDFPDATEREVRDAISKYGKTVNPSEDEVRGVISKLQRMGRYLSALEDIAEQKRPLRSGLQRDKLDAEERAMQKKIRELMKELPVDEETEAKQLKTTLDGIKTRLRNAIEDIEREIETGQKREANKGGVEYDQEAKDLREQLADLRKVREEIFGKELTDEQRISRAVAATERAAEAIQKKIDENDLSFKESKKLDDPRLTAAKERLKQVKDELNQMRDEAGVSEQRALESKIKRVKQQTEIYREKLKNKDFSKKKRQPVIENSELAKAQAEKIAIQEEYIKEYEKLELKNRTKWQKFFDVAAEIFGIPRILMATFDLSFMTIQGGAYTISGLMSRKPSVVLEGMRTAFRNMGSASKFEEWQKLIKAQESYPVMKAAKLGLSEQDAKLSAREEAGATGYANFIWDWLMTPLKFTNKSLYEKALKVNPFKVFERGGVTYMNYLRMMKFKEGMELLKMQGKTINTHTDEYKGLADMVNTFTGRASLGSGEAAAKVFSMVLFSPRNWASVIIQTSPILMAYKMHKWSAQDRPLSVAQKMVIVDYLKYIGFTLGMIGMAAAFMNNDDDDETEVNFDPRSADFLKIRMGDTRVDLFGGRSQMVVFQTRIMLEMIGRSSYVDLTGKESRLGQGTTPTMGTLGWRLLQNKLSPSVGAINEFVNTKLKKDGKELKRVTQYGEDYSFGNRVQEMSHPIFLGSIGEIVKNNPDAVGGFLVGVAAVGYGVQVYKKPKPKKKKRTL